MQPANWVLKEAEGGGWEDNKEGAGIQKWIKE